MRVINFCSFFIVLDEYFLGQWHFFYYKLFLGSFHCEVGLNKAGQQLASSATGQEAAYIHLFIKYKI